GQTSGGVAASGASWSYPGQSYQNFNVQPQTPFSPGPDWESALRTPQPMAMEDIIHSPIHLQDSQYSSQPETGQTSAGVSASGPWWNQPAPGQLQPHQGYNVPAQIPPSLGSDLGLKYLQQTLQPMVLADTVQNDASLAASNPQPDVVPQSGKARTKELFLAGLEAFARGVDLKYCSSVIRFKDYIKSDGSIVKRGAYLYDQFTEAEKEWLDQAIIARQAAQLKTAVKKRFLDGLDNYAQGVRLVDCSTTIKYRRYVTDDGQLHDVGKALYNSLSAADQARVYDALISRSESYLRRPKDKAPVEERFLASLDNYARGLKMSKCAKDIPIRNYVTSDGYLHKEGRELLARLSQGDQMRVNQALLSRRGFCSNRAKDKAPVKAPVKARFLAGLDNYMRGVPVTDCSATLFFRDYFTDDGKLGKRGQELFARLSAEDQNRVNQALITRRRMVAEQISGDLRPFLAALEPYSNGLDLQTCTEQSGLKKKAERYLTPEGGLTAKGELLIENLPPDERIDVWCKVEERRQFLDPSAQVPVSPWQLPEIPESVPEMGEMDPTSMVDPMQTETMYTYMQTEAMMAAAWQLTGQAMPGIWGIPSEPAEPSIPYYGPDVVGRDFQHRYDSNGLMPQRAPDRLIGLGIVHDTLINIQGEVYRVHDTGQRSINPTNENPLGNIFMLVPRMQGG
ncbi:MAG: hypothetical protein P8X89_23850, partial [Reinekea sp.]